MQIDRLEIKQKSGNEYGIWDHKEDCYIVILDTKYYEHVKKSLAQLKDIIDTALDNGDLDL